jgi:hypothetical protein
VEERWLSALFVTRRPKHTEVAFKNLRCKHAPKTAPSLPKLHNSFYGAKLKKKADPDVFITYLKDLRSWMEDRKYVMTDNQFILHVVNNLTEGYINQVETLERRIGSLTDQGCQRRAQSKI